MQYGAITNISPALFQFFGPLPDLPRPEITYLIKELYKEIKTRSFFRVKVDPKL